MSRFKFYSILPSVLLVSLSIVSFSSCNKHNGNSGNKRIKDGRTEELGLVFPEIRSQEHDTIKLALYPHAQFYFIDLGLKNSEDYIKLIKKANKADLPVRVKVYEENRAEVAAIIPATVEEVQQYRKNQQN